MPSNTYHFLLDRGLYFTSNYLYTVMAYKISIYKCLNIYYQINSFVLPFTAKIIKTFTIQNAVNN